MKVASWVDDIISPDGSGGYETALPSGIESIAITAGLGAGKTTGAVQAHYMLAELNRESRFSWFCEPNYGLISEVAIPAFEWLFGELGFTDGRDYKIVGTGKPYIDLLNLDHRIWLKSCENDRKLVGANISHATIDEPGQISRLARDNIFSRVRCDKAVWLLKVLSGTPEGLHHWYAEEYDIPAEQKVGSKYRFKLRTLDNTMHSNIEAYVATLRETWGHQLAKLESYINGEFTSFTTGLVFTNYTELNQSVGLAPVTSKPIRVTFDFNAYPLAYSLSQLHHEKGLPRLEYFYSSTGQHRESLRDAVHRLLIEILPAEHYESTPLIIYGDRSGHADSHKTDLTDFETIEDVLRQHRRQYEIVAPGEIVPITGSVDDVDRLLARQMIVVDRERASTLHDSLKKTTWKGNTRKIDKPAGEDWTHWGDGARYQVYWMVRSGELDWRQKQIGFSILGGKRG